MSLQDRLRAQRQRLQHTKTLVRTADGRVVEEDSRDGEQQIFQMSGVRVQL